MHKTRYESEQVLVLLSYVIGLKTASRAQGVACLCMYHTWSDRCLVLPSSLTAHNTIPPLCTLLQEVWYRTKSPNTVRSLGTIGVTLLLMGYDSDKSTAVWKPGGSSVALLASLPSPCRGCRRLLWPPPGSKRTLCTTTRLTSGFHSGFSSRGGAKATIADLRGGENYSSTLVHLCTRLWKGAPQDLLDNYIFV